MPAAAFLMNLGFAGGVAVSAAPTITTTSLANATGGVLYTATLEATDGTEPYTWTISSGSLPQGLSLSSAGVISGIPEVIESRTFTVQVTDDNSQTDTQELTLTVADPQVFGRWQRVEFPRPVPLPLRSNEEVDYFETAGLKLETPAPLPRTLSLEASDQQIIYSPCKGALHLVDGLILASQYQAVGSISLHPHPSEMDDLIDLITVGIVTNNQSITDIARVMFMEVIRADYQSSS